MLKTLTYSQLMQALEETLRKAIYEDFPVKQVEALVRKGGYLPARGVADAMRCVWQKHASHLGYRVLAYREGAVDYAVYIRQKPDGFCRWSHQILPVDLSGVIAGSVVSELDAA